MNLPHRFLITGAKGMLASDLIPILSDKSELLLTDLHPAETSVGLDVCDLQSVYRVVEEFKPDWIINCAAYTAVDQAEESSSVAFLVNSIGPGNLAEAASRFGAKLVHISSDYVFGGDGSDHNQIPYTEEDSTMPCGAYGHSKAFGDYLVKTGLPEDHLILRTSWLHGKGGPNFVETMLKVGAEKKELKVVNDQIGSPTWSKWLAEVIVQLIEKNQRGTFNASSRGGISWCEFAKGIFELANMDVNVLTQTTAELNRPAPRPYFSTLNLSKLENVLGAPAISWQDGVRGHLKELRVIK